MVTANLVFQTPSRINVNVLKPKAPSCQTFARREVLPLQANQLWSIELGCVRILTVDEYGSAITLGFARSGDLLGEPFAYSDSYYGECLTRVEASPLHHSYEVSQDTAIATIRHNYAKQSQELLCILHCKGMESRLTKLLFWLGQEFGSDVPQGRLIYPRLTHQDLAEMISATRVTVSRLLSQLERQGRVGWLKQGCVLRRGFW